MVFYWKIFSGGKKLVEDNRPPKVKKKFWVFFWEIGLLCVYCTI